MKTVLLCLLLTGCVSIEQPFKQYEAPDGTRSWTLHIRDDWKKYQGADSSDESLIAQQIAWSRLCAAGYLVDRIENMDDGRMVYGHCL